MHLDNLLTIEQLFKLCGIDNAEVMEHGIPFNLNISSDITLEWDGVVHQLKTLTMEDRSRRSFLINWTEETKFEGLWRAVRFNSDGNRC